MNKKFIVYGARITDYTSKPRFWQYVSAYDIAKCYELNPNECIIVEESGKCSLRGVDETNRYSIRARLLTRRTSKNYDESFSIIKEYDRIIQKELTDWDSLSLVHFVVNNFNEEELMYK